MYYCTALLDEDDERKRVMYVGGKMNFGFPEKNGKSVLIY
jgi:hypothetical protein